MDRLAITLMRVLPVAFAGLLSAQEAGAPPAPATIENTGRPMSMLFRCTEDDMQWAGMSCTERAPCPLYLEIAAVEGVGGHIFAGGNIHSASVTLYSMLLASDDEGRTWREAHEGIRGAGLDGIQFVGPETGWVSGQTLSPLPQSPFFLLTTDGGRTWRRQSVFGEDRSGLVQDFYFADKKDGSLVFDRGAGADGRYQLYASTDGGETWTIKQETDEPIRLRAPRESARWRARVDGPSESYRLERREGERWIGVASFAVKAGSCKP
jgi:photosystem II stability/assembly factor-like uncharacterized protein